LNLELKDLVYRFKDYIFSERNLSENTMDSYYSDIMQFYEYLEKLLPPADISGYFGIEILDDYIIYLANNEIGSRSIVRKLSAISLFLKFLKIEEVIKENSSYLINRPKIGSKLPLYLTVEEVEAFINSFSTGKPESIRDKALFELIYSCGLRVSEISNLNLGSVYFKEKIIQVFGKGSKERYVPVGEKALKELENYLENARPLLLKKKKTQALFINFRGERLSRKGIWRNLKLNASLAGIKKDFSVHTLRHSFATHLVQNGADIRGIQELLGHKNVATTEIYTHLDLSHIKEVYGKFHSHK
jgi:integrase/recombinase XerD